jgi:hypothetical protein
MLNALWRPGSTGLSGGAGRRGQYGSLADVLTRLENVTERGVRQLLTRPDRLRQKACAHLGSKQAQCVTRRERSAVIVSDLEISKEQFGADTGWTI